MNVHKNAKLTPLGRAEIVHRVLEEGQTPTAVATAVGVCERTVRKWVARAVQESSAPARSRVRRRLLHARRVVSAMQRGRVSLL